VPNRGAARLLVLLTMAGLLSVAAPASADERVPRPVLNVDFPDPAVVATPGGLVAYATGDRVPHAWSRGADGPWRRGPSLLTHRPSWSRAGGVWAVDVARVRGRWLLYYATPVRGIGETGRSAAPRWSARPTPVRLPRRTRCCRATVRSRAPA
jgi:arabinan endo-1,5-alpha-L-arabinosidase